MAKMIKGREDVATPETKRKKLQFTPDEMKKGVKSIKASLVKESKLKDSMGNISDVKYNRKDKKAESPISKLRKIVGEAK